MVNQGCPKGRPFVFSTYSASFGKRKAFLYGILYNQNMKQGRLSYVDIGRFFPMVLIMLLHVLQRTSPGFTKAWPSVYFLVLGLAPFFFFSGLVHAKREPLRPVGFVYDVFKRAFAYFLPFIWFLLFRVLLYGQWVDFPAAFASALDYPVSTLWFCWVLVWIMAFVDIGLLLSSLCPRFKKLIVTFVLIGAFLVLINLRFMGAIPNHHFLGYDYFVIYAPVFLAGYLFGEKLFSINKIPVSVTCLCVGLGALVPIAMNNNQIIQVTFLESKWMFYLACLCAIVAIYGLVSLLRDHAWAGIFAFGGRFTIEAYFLHLMLIKNWGVMHLENGWAILGMTIGLFLLLVVNTVAVVAVSYFVPFLHFIMFGRHLSFWRFENALWNKLRDWCLSL